jgi:hypothetical protein
MHTSCQWKDDYWHDWYAKILIGTIVGTIVTIATTVVLSLPVCCGVMKDSPSLKVIAIVCSVVAFFCFFVPMIAGSASSGALVDDICNACDDGCTEAERDEMDGHVSGAGIWVAYTYGFGFLVLVIGGVAMCLSCCVCCPCCGPLQSAKQSREMPGQQVPGVQGEVVGQPVQQCS